MKQNYFTVTFRINGMNCANCENRIEQTLKHNNGIANSIVSYGKGTALVTFDPERTDAAEIARTIENLGYSVILPTKAMNTKPENKQSKIILAIGIIVILIALYVLSALTGYAIPFVPELGSRNVSAESTQGSKAEITGGVQRVTTKLESRSYEPIVVQKGVPVQWTIQAGASDINGCNSRIVIPEYNLEKKLEPGDNIIEFTPDKSGVVPYSCWMGMIRSQIKNCF